MIDINRVLLLVNLYQESAEKLHKPVIGNFEKRKVHSPFIDNISYR